MMKNITINKKEKTFTVNLPKGKKCVYKTLKGAETCAVRELVTINIPAVVTANTYFWSSQGSASGRRSNESRHQNTIADFCLSVNALVPTVQAEGTYRETCSNVYKSMTYRVFKNSEWVLTNITGFIGECTRHGVQLIK